MLRIQPHHFPITLMGKEDVAKANFPEQGKARRDTLCVVIGGGVVCMCVQQGKLGSRDDDGVLEG